MKATLAKKTVPNNFTMHMAFTCFSCNGSEKSVRREFSDQAWAALTVWGEIDANSVDKPICNDCYSNLRDVLIERSEDVSTAALVARNSQRRPSNLRAVNI